MRLFSTGRKGHPEDVHIWGRPLALALIVLYEGGTGFLYAIFGAAALLVVNGVWHIAPMAALKSFVMSELADDPQDLLFNWIAGHFPQISHDASLHLAWIVIIFGLVKAAIAGWLWYEARTARQAAVVIFGVFGLYGVYNMFSSVSVVKLIAIMIDVFFMYYFWFELPRHIAADARAPVAVRT